ncbi:hypothetical protein Tco_1306703, partial [Tanacetum coccineum]
MEELKNGKRKRRGLSIYNQDFSFENSNQQFGYQVCSIPVTVGKSYKVEVLCIVDDIDECHILLGRPCQCEVNGKYDLKKSLFFSWEGRRIAMVPPKVTPQLPKPEVKVEERIMKAEVVDEHIEKIQDLQSYKQHNNKILTLLFETTNKDGTLKTCEEIMGSNDDEDVNGFNYELKIDFECIHNLNVRDLDYGLILRIIIKNQIKFSMEYGRRVKKYEGFRMDVKRKSIEDKVRREDWSLPKILPEVRKNKVADAFQEEDELYCKILVSKALVKAFKLLTEPHPSPYQIGWLKKGPTLKVNGIFKVSLAIRKHYNELVTCDVVDIEACHVLLGRSWKHDMDATYQGKSNMYLFNWSKKTIAMLSLGVISPKTKLETKTLVTLVASPKEFQAERKQTRFSFALVMNGVKYVMENAIPVVIKQLLAEFGKIMMDDTLDALPPLRNIQHQINLSRKTILLLSISNEVLGFGSFKELYASNEDLGNTWMELETKQHL